MLYYHSTNKGPKERRACVAATVVEGWMQFGVAVCSRDDQYTKRVGRQIAAGRAIKRPISKIPLGTRDPIDVFHKHTKAIAEAQISKYNN